MEKQYLQQVLNGNKEAFRYLVEMHQDGAWAVALSVVKDEFAARDILQESFLKAFRNLKSFKFKSKFSTWLHRIVINEALKHINKQKQHRPAEGNPDEFEQNEINEAIELLKQEDQKYFLDMALKQMPAAESLILTLFYLEENSLDEIQGVTGYSISKVKVLLHRGRKRMYMLLKLLLNRDIKTLY